MNKPELVAALVERFHDARPPLTRARAAELLEALFGDEGIVTTGLARGERVHLAGFGTFERRERAGRRTVNPRTGQPVELAASVAPAFKPAQKLKDAVRQGRGRRAPG